MIQILGVIQDSTGFAKPRMPRGGWPRKSRTVIVANDDNSSSLMPLAIYQNQKMGSGFDGHPTSCCEGTLFRGEPRTVLDSP